jgi:outer membrane protein
VKKIIFVGKLNLCYNHNNIRMKGTSLIVSIVLFVAIAVLYVLHFTGSGRNTSNQLSGQDRQLNSGGLRVAYLKADSLIVNYDLAQDLHDLFTQKEQAYNAEFGTRRSTFEREAGEFQEKLNRGGFLTQDRAIQERDKLAGKEQEIMKLNQEYSGKLAELQAANNKQILDSLISYLKIYNKDKKYDYILNSADILIGNEASNITAEVLRKMNQTYKSSKTRK